MGWRSVHSLLCRDLSLASVTVLKPIIPFYCRLFSPAKKRGCFFSIDAYWGVVSCMHACGRIQNNLWVFECKESLCNFVVDFIYITNVRCLFIFFIFSNKQPHIFSLSCGNVVPTFLTVKRCKIGFMKPFRANMEERKLTKKCQVKEWHKQAAKNIKTKKYIYIMKHEFEWDETGCRPPYRVKTGHLLV